MEHRKYTGMILMLVRARSDPRILSLTGISELNHLLLWSLDSGMTFCSVWSSTEETHRCIVFSTFTKKVWTHYCKGEHGVSMLTFHNTVPESHPYLFIYLFCESLCPELVRDRKDLVSRLLRWQDILWRISLAVSNTHPWCQVSCRLNRSVDCDILSVCISGLFFIFVFFLLSCLLLCGGPT